MLMSSLLPRYGFTVECGDGIVAIAAAADFSHSPDLPNQKENENR